MTGTRKNVVTYEVPCQGGGLTLILRQSRQVAKLRISRHGALHSQS